MLSITTLASFGVSAFVLCLAPGPDNLFVLTQSVMYGRKAGVMVSLGLCTGLIFHTALVAFGVAAIFQHSALAFTLLKMVGAGYLLWLGWQAWRSAPHTLSGSPDSASPLGALYRRGILMNMSNPKVSLFFLAFLPQFVSRDAGPLLPQFFVLGGIFMLLTIIVFGGIALAASALTSWFLDSGARQVYLNKVSALILFALALRLLTLAQ